MIQKMKNRKGFTLIEMLVVIAIIAVLVAIIIPTVSSATGKAGAAANAANLRAVYAEVQTDMLTVTGNDTTGYVTWTNGTPSLSNAPAAAKAGDVEKDAPMVIEVDGKGGWTVNYGKSGDVVYDITYFANIAGGEQQSSETED